MQKTVLIVGLVMALLAPVSALGAAGDIKVTGNEATPKFAQGVVFRLQAESSSPITEVLLFYHQTLEIAVNRAYPTFTAGPKVTAEFTWDLLPGEVPVGAQVQYYWTIKTAGGQQFRTETKAFPYDDSRFQWQKIEKNNVNLFYYGGNQNLAVRIQDSALAALAHIKAEIGVSPALPVKIYVYDSKQDMAGALFSQSQSYDAAVDVLGVKISKDTVLLLGSAVGASETIAHELTHVVVGQATENQFQADLPRWLDEGLAMYNEGSLPDYNQQALDDAIAANSLLSVRSCTAYPGADDINLFYGESYSIISFLLKQYGKDKMVALLNEFRKGAYQDDALQAIYGFGLEGLDDHWRVHRRRTTAGANAPAKRRLGFGPAAQEPAAGSRVMPGHSTSRNAYRFISCP